MDVYSALADENRRKIIEIIAHKGKISSTEIAGKFTISAPAISQHLKILREAKIVDMEKNAQQHLYSINPNSLDEVEEWTKKMTTLWNQRFDALDTVLQKEKLKLLRKEEKHGRKK